MRPFKQRENENETKGTNQVPEAEEILKDVRRVDVCEEDVEDVRLPGDDILDHEERAEGEEEGSSPSVFPSDEDCLDGVDQMNWREQSAHCQSLPLGQFGWFSQGETVEKLENVADTAG